MLDIVECADDRSLLGLARQEPSQKKNSGNSKQLSDSRSGKII